MLDKIIKTHKRNESLDKEVGMRYSHGQIYYGYLIPMIHVWNSFNRCPTIITRWWSDV